MLYTVVYDLKSSTFYCSLSVEYCVLLLYAAMLAVLLYNYSIILLLLLP